MKRILLSSLFIILSHGLFSQAYKALLDHKNEWHVTVCGISGCLTDVYVAADDTLISGQAYTILDKFHYISRTFLLKEDTSTRQVFITLLVNGRPSEDVLLYDFGMNIGDSIHIQNPISPFPSDAGNFALDSIVGKTLWDGEVYRHFYLTAQDSVKAASPNAVWIEGIGSLLLINTPGATADINNAGHISCMFKDGNLIYSNTDSISSCSEVYFLSEEQDEVSSKMSVFPTVSTDLFTIESSSRISLITLVGINGQNLKQINFSIPKEQYVLDLSEYSKGIYFLNIEDANGVFHKKRLIKE